MIKRYIVTVLLSTMLLSTGKSFATTECRLKLNTGLAIPISSYISSYLESGLGGGLGLAFKKNFWPFSLNLSASFFRHSLQEKTDSFYNQIPITAALEYNQPLNKQFFLSFYAESGLLFEILQASGSSDYNSAFTMGLGSSLGWNATQGWVLGITVGYSIITEGAETSSFLRLLLFTDIKL